MTDRPILFSSPMVRALLDGRKTQTRRVLKPGKKPAVIMDGEGELLDPSISPPRFVEGDRLWVKETWSHSGHGVWTIGDARRQISGAPIYRATADIDPGIKWFPSIFMPREFSRLTLTVSNLRVERLQDCSQEDAIAEGIEGGHHPDTGEPCGWKSYEIIHSGRHKGRRNPHAIVPNKSPVTSYAEIWNSINGPGAWDANPWVVAISFDVRKGNIDV